MSPKIYLFILPIFLIGCSTLTLKPNQILNQYFLEIEVSPACQCARSVSINYEVPPTPMSLSSLWIYSKSHHDTLTQDDFCIVLERNTRDSLKIVKGVKGKITFYNTSKWMRIDLLYPYFDSTLKSIKYEEFPYNGVYNYERYSTYKRK